ncbi:hypothetical protein [Stakelama saccharophila]|uniref:Glycosyltransferase RgtA/B/C/D-like domain-containing protein n=1 Tax=Stakelama saccharophila TaxID=3075605 RepID=A0ABZ0BCH5_9SPHN|nr:hypothetical protein [Stakelama sp. W311]WNO55094.1 hypothetical protein RPR59_02670 [Stakelama sp. W311]
MERSGDDRLHWWQTRWFVVFIAVMAAVPLVWPGIPPLVDLPGHMGRYRVQESWDSARWLRDWYDFDWQVIGNLGIDLLIVPFTKLFGLEAGVKLIVMAIPVLTAAGLLWIAREVHGRIPATALFALPIVYSYPFHFGFVNFALSMALALNAFALWLRLARLGHIRLRAIVFVPISALIWLTHAYGWGTLGVLAFSAELVRQADMRGGGWKGWTTGWLFAGLHCLVLAPPAFLMVLWRSGGHVSGQTADWFNWRAKMLWVTMVLRDRWQLFDLACLAVFYLVLFKGVRDPNIQYSRNLTLSALFLLAVYLLLPRIVFGSAYADMRLVPFLFGIALIALRPKPGLPIRRATVVAALGLAFFLVRMGATTASFYLYDRSYDRQLAALEHVPVGARLLTFVGTTCRYRWTMSRLEHIPGIALERRLAFSNDQWSMAGGQLLTVDYPAGRGFNHDPSQMVTQRKCRGEFWRPVDVALAYFPRAAFDYVWLVDPPPYDAALVRDLTPVWRDGDSALFRIDHRAAGISRPS